MAVRTALKFLASKPEIVPLFAVTGLGVLLACGIVARNYGPNRVSWTVAGRHPERNVQPWENTKLLSINRKFVKPEFVE